MKTALYEGKRKIKIVEKPDPIPEKNEVVIKVKHTGICGSDLEFYKTGLWPEKGILGHEIMGIIKELGSEVKKWKSGDRVTIDPALPCGRCYYCKKGGTNLCSGTEAIGLGRDGGFAEYIKVPERCIIKLPDAIPDKHGTVFDQIGTGLMALKKINFKIGDTAVVLGMGTIGLFLLQLLKISGASRIVVIEKNINRLEVAKRFNPDLALTKVNHPKIKRIVGRIGATHVFECSGSPQLVNAALDITCKDGNVIQIGLWDKPIEISITKYVMNQIRIQGIIGCSREDFEFAIELVAKKMIDPEPIITKIIPLDRIVEEGFESAISPNTSDIKILVAP